jgi:hypothetical protein
MCLSHNINNLIYISSFRNKFREILKLLSFLLIYFYTLPVHYEACNMSEQKKWTCLCFVASTVPTSICQTTFGNFSGPPSVLPKWQFPYLSGPLATWPRGEAGNLNFTDFPTPHQPRAAGMEKELKDSHIGSPSST